MIECLLENIFEKVGRQNYLLSKQDENLAKLLEILEARTLNKSWKMLTNALRSLLYKYFQKIFMRKKKQLIVLTIFYISQESNVKTLLK